MLFLNYLGIIEDLPEVIVQVVQRVRFRVYKVAKFLAVINIEEDVLERKLLLNYSIY